jgi:ketosteroid isomerase-like protein
VSSWLAARSYDIAPARYGLAMTAPHDQLAIRRLVDAYAIAIDDCDIDALASLWLPEGRLLFCVPERPEALATFAGLEQIADIPRMLREVYRRTLHVVGTHLADVDGDRATGTTYTMAYHVLRAEDSGDVETLAVRYRDTLVRTGDGWRFQTREVFRLWRQRASSWEQPLAIDLAAARSRERDPD